MRTNIVIDEKLMKDALRSSGVKTKRDVVELGLRTLVQLAQQEKETRQVMAIVAVMAESMADREKQYNVRFRGIGKKLRSTGLIAMGTKCFAGTRHAAR